MEERNSIIKCEREGERLTGVRVGIRKNILFGPFYVSLSIKKEKKLSLDFHYLQ